MNAQQADNLRVLVRHMESECNRMLYMGDVFHACGTPACALGEAWIVPELRHRFTGKPELHRYGAVCQEVFGVADHFPLFGGSFSNVWGRNDVLPREWAVEARKSLAEHGYSMDDTPAKPDAFAAFMAKVQEPVAVTA